MLALFFEMLEMVILFFGLNAKALKPSLGNAKMKYLAKVTGLKVIAFDLPAGWTCPAADVCLSRWNFSLRKIIKGEYSRFLCYASKAEALYKAVFLSRWNNARLIKEAASLGLEAGLAEMIRLISEMVEAYDIIRIHASGDYFLAIYFKAWLAIAKLFPSKIFFGYTKVLPYYKAARLEGLDNFKLQYSFGGLFDRQALASFYGDDQVKICFVITKEWLVEVVDGEIIASSYITFGSDNKAIISKVDNGGLYISVKCQSDKADDYSFIMADQSFGILVH